MMNTSQIKAANLKSRKGGAPISCLTGYDYATGRLLDEAGVDVILVGDSLGMVVLGFPDTTHVTMEHMLHHVAAVRRGVKDAMIVGDMPIHSYDTVEMALENARRLHAAGADAVKLEGGVMQSEKVRSIVAAGIPVLGHMGMLPQSVLEEGGYKKKGKTQSEADALLEGCFSLQTAGVFGIVLESVVESVARKISTELKVPTIGIGCGKGSCDGEVAVISDVVGAYPWFVPPFATVRAHVADDISRAIKDYIADVAKF